MPVLDYIHRILGSKLCSNKPVVLVYHSICPANSTTDSKWSLAYNEFVSQLDTIQNLGWKTGRISDLAKATPSDNKTVYITFDDGFADNLPAFAALKERNMLATLYMVSGALGKKTPWTDPDSPRRSMLGQEELLDIQKSGFEIGCHGAQHLDLTQLDDQQLTSEIRGSKAHLEDILGTAVPSIAYPYGKFDDRVVAATKAAGYETACSTRSGWALATDDLFKIHRITVFADDNLRAWIKKIITCSNAPTNGMILNQIKALASARLN